MSGQALVIGASGGIGGALVKALEERGLRVQTLSRSVDGFDITDQASVDRALGSLKGPYDLIIVATGALEIDGAEPEKTIRAISQQAMTDQLTLNAVGPALVLRHAADLLPKDTRGVFAVMSARVGSIGDNRLGGWISYRTAKAAVNQVVHTASIELARSHPHSICVAMHPGTVKTQFTEKYLGRHPATEPSEAAAHLLDVIDGLVPDDTGQFFDWAGKAVPW
ncbi:SDR family NAD(P)-dependent oxidoreductase [Sulfitobacter sp. TSTF-M16]|uniref:SDR family NAD(P)-dependent oxidoreductase n=1 Tax=Sulfitobacter aestuariivivens TaxID=2766981 RepID=A0A927D611_9RHOB|nr:SDR family NAD(P)-dependent oxidoreductase [Sulfitobacter aestuariivivens]MBD3665850.1 SDR family NAD(P)-dependent oxidoreductase [Sulfitobacter aestuariivivens]